MKPAGLKTRIFLDGGDAKETAAVMQLLGFLEGQTTNPTLIAKNPAAAERLAAGKKFSSIEIYEFYRGVVTEVSKLLPDGSVSIEVYADKTTTAEAMFAQAKEMFSWIPNAHIKFPVIPAGLEAAEWCIAEGMRVNMTLCFSQEQAAAVASALRNAPKGAAFISPFVGRLDDQGENGMDLIANIARMYREQGSNVEVLSASIRSLDHLYASIAFGANIATVPQKVLADWSAAGLALPDKGFTYTPANLKPIPYQEFDLSKPYQSFKISHPLTDKGIDRFAADWNALIA